MGLGIFLGFPIRGSQHETKLHLFWPLSSALPVDISRVSLGIFVRHSVPLARSWRALQVGLQDRENRMKCSAAKSQKGRICSPRFSYLGGFPVDLRPNDPSVCVGLNTLSIEHSNGYRLMCDWVKFVQIWASYYELKRAAHQSLLVPQSSYFNWNLRPSCLFDWIRVKRLLIEHWKSYRLI